jgi:hypothetical protein
MRFPPSAPRDPHTDENPQQVAGQIALIQQLRDAVGKQPTRYAGLSAHGPGRVVIYLAGTTANPDSVVSQILTTAADRGVQVSIERKPRSLSQLTHVMDSIPHSSVFSGPGSDLVSWGIEPERNVVQVGVTNITPELAARAQSEYGDTVELVHQEPFIQV